MVVVMKSFIVVLMLCFSVFSHSQLGQSMLIDPKALSLGNAVTADPPGMASIHYNPAGLTKLDGRQIGVTMLNVILKSEATFNLPEDYDGDGELLNFEDDPVIGKKSEPLFRKIFQQHDTCRRLACSVSSRQTHCIRLLDLRIHRLLKPLFKQYKR